MTDGKDTAWKFYGLLGAVGVVGLIAGAALGTYVLAPKFNKNLVAKKKSGDKKTETTSKKTT